MIGGVVFTISFLLFALISLNISLPPADWILNTLGISVPVYGAYVIAIVNGVVWGIVIWVLFSIFRFTATAREEKRS